MKLTILVVQMSPSVCAPRCYNTPFYLENGSEGSNKQCCLPSSIPFQIDFATPLRMRRDICTQYYYIPLCSNRVRTLRGHFQNGLWSLSDSRAGRRSQSS
ncbi:hypothetical protein PR002_g8565 [Phytophthora rubi]|uniref:Uncharacterized protein n=1 Tax=Phytophthora rubi TaxID=129364 RepID=A0A6A3MWV5_9STRA|nr:hypothetical protein PR002_g8565 [Phytophthora rubi]